MVPLCIIGFIHTCFWSHHDKQHMRLKATWLDKSNNTPGTVLWYTQYVMLNGLNIYFCIAGIYLMLGIQAACRWQWHQSLPILILLLVPIYCCNKLLLFHLNQNVLLLVGHHHSCNLRKCLNIKALAWLKTYTHLL